MDEPNHERESRFWDRVADWLLGIHEAGVDVLSQAEIGAFSRDQDECAGSEPE
jgi:hypothetical protein